MPVPHIPSVAFRQALLRSEQLRIVGILGFVAVLWLAGMLRVLRLHDAVQTALWWRGQIIMAAFVAYEVLLLRTVRRATDAGTDVRSRVWLVSLIIETSLPAVALALLNNPAVALAYRPLASPAVLTFFLFIIMSTLRLSPRLCQATGLVAAVSYLAAAVHVGWRPLVVDPGGEAVTRTAVPMYALIMLVGGFVAGAVAREIRKHVNAALREAEVRREMERLQHDLDVARSIQQGLLPHVVPQVTGFEIAGWSQPADKTGGDYYDWQELPDGRWVAMLADVTGHGIGPALLAAVCRAYARASFGLGEDLGTAMERINRALLADLSDGRFVTFVATVCGPGSGKVQLLSAGHGPLFVYYLRADAATAFTAQGLPFGIAPGFASEPVHEFELEPGDMIVLATDGFFEWEDAEGEQFGAARLEEVIRAASSLPPRPLIARLYDAVVRFSGGTPQQDDLTAVVIRRVEA